MQEQTVKTPQFETLDLKVENAVAEVFLNRGDKANSMSAPMWRELQACFEWLDAEPTVRAVILAAHGKHFCAGIDLTMLSSVQGEAMEPSRRAEAFVRNVRGMQDNLSAMEKCRKPVLAAIHNTCIGGAIGFALGVAASVGFTSLINSLTSGTQWPIVISLPAAGVAFLFAAAVGIFFGFYPARRASRLDPIEALRYE